jgi:hypothetical protein
LGGRAARGAAARGARQGIPGVRGFGFGDDPDRLALPVDPGRPRL